MDETRRNTPLRGGAHEPANETSRQAIESLIDDIGAQSFPASDPPAWGVVSSRLEQAKRDAKEAPRRDGFNGPRTA